jgi:hypothetical protein
MQQNEWTVLHNAAWKGHKETVLALLQAGADVHAKTKVRGGLLSVMSRGLVNSCVWLFPVRDAYIYIYVHTRMRVYTCLMYMERVGFTGQGRIDMDICIQVFTCLHGLGIQGQDMEF